MKKHLFCSALGLALLLAAFLGHTLLASADGTPTDLTIYSTEGNEFFSDSRTINKWGGTVTWDVDTKTLTLNDVNIESNFDGPTMVISGSDVKICIEGTNTITTIHGRDIYAPSTNITFTGTGKLIFRGSTHGYEILRGQNITFLSGEYEISLGSQTGFAVTNNDNGTIEIFGGTFSSNHFLLQAFECSTLNISGGTIDLNYRWRMITATTVNFTGGELSGTRCRADATLFNDTCTLNVYENGAVYLGSSSSDAQYVENPTVAEINAATYFSLRQRPIPVNEDANETTGEPEILWYDQINDSIIEAGESGEEIVIHETSGMALTKEVILTLMKYKNVSILYSFDWEIEGTLKHFDVLIKGGQKLVEDEDVLWYGPLYLLKLYGPYVPDKK